MLDDRKSRFGIRVNGSTLREPTAGLQDGDQLVMGAAEAEAIRISRLRLSVVFDDSLLEAGKLLPLFPFDARMAASFEEASHMILPDQCPITLAVCLAILRGIELTKLSFLEEFLATRIPAATEHVPVFLLNGTERRADFSLNRQGLLAGHQFVSEQSDSSFTLFALELGASVLQTPPQTSYRLLRPDLHDTLISGFLDGDMTEFLASCPLVDPTRIVISVDSEEDLFAQDDVPMIDVMEITKVKAVSEESFLVPSKATESMTGITNSISPETFNMPRRSDPPPADSDVKMVVSYADLYRKSRPAQTTTPTPGANFKKFQKKQPVRRASECIGFADMRPYRSVLDTTAASPGEQRGKRDDWLEPGQRRTPTREIRIAPAAAVQSHGETEFKSSFFTGAMNFD